MHPLRLAALSIACAVLLIAPGRAIVSGAAESLPQDAPGKKAPAFEDEVRGGFRLQKDGVGFMVLDGCLLAEVMTVRSGNVVPGIFLLDMGGGKVCTVDKGFAAKLTLGEDETVALKFGHKETFGNVPVAVKELADLHKCSKRNASVLQGKAVNGVIGFGIFDGRTIVIDYGACRLRFIDPGSADTEESGEKQNTPPSPWEIDFAMTPAPYCCAVRINDKGPFTFQLNTTCPRSWIKKEAASRAAWRRGKKPGSFLLAGLDMTAVSVSFEFKGFKAGQEVPPVDGVLGNDFLSHFEVTVDTARGRVLFQSIK